MYMQGQDWTPVVLSKKPDAENARGRSRRHNEAAARLHKVESTEVAKTKKVPRAAAQGISRARVAQKWTQAELARRMQCTAKQVADMEAARAPLDARLLRRAGQVLRVSLQWS